MQQVRYVNLHTKILTNNLLYFCPLAIQIMHRVIERLGVQVRIMGFDNESAMINDLAATPRSLIQTCFAHGAGEMKSMLPCSSKSLAPLIIGIL